LLKQLLTNLLSFVAYNLQNSYLYTMSSLDFVNGPLPFLVIRHPGDSRVIGALCAMVLAKSSGDISFGIYFQSSSFLILSNREGLRDQ
jgi:hypothetical protein